MHPEEIEGKRVERDLIRNTYTEGSREGFHCFRFVAPGMEHPSTEGKKPPKNFYTKKHICTNRTSFDLVCMCVYVRMALWQFLHGSDILHSQRLPRVSQKIHLTGTWNRTNPPLRREFPIVSRQQQCNKTTTTTPGVSLRGVGFITCHLSEKKIVGGVRQLPLGPREHAQRPACFLGGWGKVRGLRKPRISTSTQTHTRIYPKTSQKTLRCVCR